MNAPEIRQKVTDTIVNSIEQGNVVCWRQPWSNDSNGFGLATSLSTGNCYNGINQVLLQAIASDRGIKSRWFGTFNQIRNAGASVRKGQKGIKVVLWKPVKRERKNRNGDTKEESFLIMKEFTVFSVEQTTGLDQFQVGHAKPSTSDVVGFENADHFFASLGLDLRLGGNKAFYSLSDDYIQMPFQHQFESPAAYFETLAHESIHWCEKRIGFDRSKYEQSYAFAELVAELGSCFLSQHLGIPVSLSNSTAYIEHWLTGMKNNTKFIFDAASHASKAVEHLLTIAASPKQAVA